MIKSKLVVRENLNASRLTKKRIEEDDLFTQKLQRAYSTISASGAMQSEAQQIMLNNKKVNK
jgi:hypothetical protein